ncbi:plasmolipin [Plectropomus leopardus]|uniref:plasmolipin n=1 Tax=Plectropomus leopardus TaxID=160734 RepID=UPI001C4AB078|nr:plasmolipin [Plectropomus leopardus]
MTDFPSKVTTETSSPNSQSSQQGGNSLQGLTANVTTMMDISFIRSIPAILMLAEIIAGLLQWALIASVPYTLVPELGWVMFVAVSFWILTCALFFVILFGTQQKLTAIPWSLTVMVYHISAAVLYLTAFLANAASVRYFNGTYLYGHMAASVFFAALATLAYGASAYFSYLEWKGDGGNAATNTVPT